MSKAELGPEIPNHLVIPDIHGNRELAEKAVGLAEDFGAMPVFLGDVISYGKDSRGTVELIASLGDKALTIAGNHEWICRNALYSPDNEASALCRDEVWGSILEKNILESYGVETEGDTTVDALHLRQAMEEAGHWDWLESLPPFFETRQFIAVHAGPLRDTPWSTQREDLLRESEPGTRLVEEPLQIMDPAHKLAGVDDVPEEVDSRTFVTGHNHFSLPASERTAERRVCLASKLGQGQPLFVWESITGAIREIKS